MNKLETVITSKDNNITILNNDTEYNDLHSKIMSLKPGQDIIVGHISEDTWYCEKPYVFDDHVLAYGWQR